MAKWCRHPTWDDYEISEDGNVRRPERCKTRPSGHVLKGCINVHGYREYKLSTIEGKKKLLSHRLVLEAFVGPCPEGHQCAHFDGNRLNNHVSNLRWATPKENSLDTARHGSLKGTKNGRSILSEEQVLSLRQEYKCLNNKYGMVSLMQRKYGLTRGTLLSIVNNRTWKHL